MEGKKEAEVTIQLSDKTDFKEGYYIMVKGSMQQEDLIILNIHALNTGAPRFIKNVLKDLQRDLDSHTIIVGYFNTSLSTLDQQNRKLTRISRLELRSGPSRPNRHL